MKTLLSQTVAKPHDALLVSFLEESGWQTPLRRSTCWK